MKGISFTLTAALTLLASPMAATAQYRAHSPAGDTVEARSPAPSAVPAPAPSVLPPSFASRALLAGAGGAAGFIALGYTAFAMKGGPEGCDLCWETTVAAFVGSALGAAGAATLAGGDMRKGLAGAALGAAAGLAVIAILDEVADPSEGTFVVSYTVTQSLFTAWFSGR